MRLNPRVKRALLIAAILAAIWAALAWYFRPNPEPFTATQTTAQAGAEPYNITLVQTARTGRRILTCDASTHCQPQVPVSSANSPAVTDGASWYYYQDETLKRIWPATGQIQTIIAQTPLAAPRDLIISPDNQKVAFWLDNIDDPKAGLTELWVYDATAGGTKVLAENVSRDAVLTAPRWNKASTQLWFLGDTSASQEPAKIDLLVVSLNPPDISAKFSQLNWQNFTKLATNEPMDINQAGTQLAYGQPKTLRTSSLLITAGQSPPSAVTVRGQLVHFTWLENDDLIYATQDRSGFTFWRLTTGQHRKLFRSPGNLQSATASSSGDYLAFAHTAPGSQITISVFNATTGAVTRHYETPVFGSRTHIVSASPANTSDTTDLNVALELDDSQLTNFIQTNLADITRTNDAEPVSLVTTDQINTVFFVYRAPAGAPRRLLLTINNAGNLTWSIRARYTEQGGEWIKTEGASTTDPKPRRLYDWETDLNQWILKKEY